MAVRTKSRGVLAGSHWRFGGLGHPFGDRVAVRSGILNTEPTSVLRPHRNRRKWPSAFLGAGGTDQGTTL
jgi:hypothetical protein